jgi:hypothetical protein
MVPIEVTHQVLVTPRVRARILAGPGAAAAAGAGAANDASGGDGGGADAKSLAAAAAPPAAPAATTAFRATANELLSFFEATYKELFAFEAAPLHDPVAVAAVIAPAIFKVRGVCIYERCSCLFCFCSLLSLSVSPLSSPLCCCRVQPLSSPLICHKQLPTHTATTL